MKPSGLLAPLTRRDLDDILLDLAPDDSMALAPSCHVTAATHVSYEAGALMLSCAKCKQFMVAVAVKPER